MKRFFVFAAVFVVVVSASICSILADPTEKNVYNVVSSKNEATPIVKADSDLPKRYVNLIGNPGFEENLTGWNTYVGFGTIDLDSEVSHTGGKSLKITRDKYGYGYAGQRINFGNTTARYFSVSGWAKSENVPGVYPFFELWVYVVYEDDTYNNFYARFSNGTHDWEHRVLPFSTDASKQVNFIEVYARFQDVGGTVWFDDVSLVWVDAYVKARVVDQDSRNVVNASVKVYDASNLLVQEYTGEDGTASFLLPANETIVYRFRIYWKGLVVVEENVKVTQDAELLFSVVSGLQIVNVTVILRDIFGQPLSGIVVKISSRPLTSLEDFLSGEFSTGSNGEVELSLVKGGAEITGAFNHDDYANEAREIVVVDSGVSVVLRFAVIKLGGLILPVSQFVLYSSLALFVGVGMLVVCRDVYKWIRERNVSSDVSQEQK